MDVGQVLIGGGALAAITTFVVAMVRIALSASERRADDWREVARMKGEENAVLNANVGKLAASVEQLAASAREQTSLLQQVVTQRRDVS